MKSTVYDSYTINDVMVSFEENHERVAVVLNNLNKVIGVVSQGDIIRALVNGRSVYTVISNIISPNFIHLKKKDMNKAYKIFKERQITLLPVVDEHYELIDLITMEDIYVYMENKN